MFSDIQPQNHEPTILRQNATKCCGFAFSLPSNQHKPCQMCVCACVCISTHATRTCLSVAYTGLDQQCQETDVLELVVPKTVIETIGETQKLGLTRSVLAVCVCVCVVVSVLVVSVLAVCVLAVCVLAVCVFLCQ